MIYRDFVEIVKEELPERLPESLRGAVIDDAKVDKLQDSPMKESGLFPRIPLSACLWIYSRILKWLLRACQWGKS